MVFSSEAMQTICKAAFVANQEPKLLKLGPLKLGEIMNIEHTVRITYHNNQFHMCIPYKPTVTASATNWNEIKAVALEPGVRKFMTGFDLNDGHVVEFGVGGMNRIGNLCYRMGRLLHESQVQKQEM